LGEDFSGVDLFGDAVASRCAGPGRPEHVWTIENSNKVLLAFARGRSPKDAATAIGVSVPTLRKHYSSEVAQREAAALRMEATQLSRLNDAAARGSVPAEKQLMKELQKGRLDALASKVAGRDARPLKAPPLGKKEQAKASAKAVGGKFAPPPAPSLLH
jgi:hypothetical protein